MTRSLPTTVSSGIAETSLSVFWAVDLLFDSPNDLYFWSGVGDLSLDGNTYTGSGDLLQISDIRESSDIAAYGATLDLSGIPSNTVALAESEPYQGRKCIIKFGVLAFGANPTDAFTVFSGEMDQMTIQIGPTTASISLEVESRLIDLRRPRLRRYTDADQQSRYPGDLAFEFVTRLQTESLEWGG